AFDILEYRVEGNTALPAPAIEAAVYPHLGPGRSLRDVEAARVALDQAYKEAGFLTVDVLLPQQKVEGGVVRLQVIEGRVEDRRVSGNRYTLRSEVRAGTPSLAEGSVPNFNDMQQELAGLASGADRQVTPLLRPGGAPGTFDVELVVEDRLPLHASVTLNNNRTPDTAPGRLEASLRYDNLFQRRHSAGLSWIVARRRSEVDVLVGNYSLPLADRGWSLALYGVRSNSDIEAIGSGTSTTGRGVTLGARLVRAFDPFAGGRLRHNLSFGLDYKDFDETTDLLGADRSRRSISYAAGALQYSLARPNDAGPAWKIGAGVGLGLRGLLQRRIDCDGVQLDPFECKRAGASASFAVFKADADLNLPLPGRWSLAARLGGQGASQPLISNEQIAAGGAETVRGYLDAEQLGDYGATGRLELVSPPFLRESLDGGRMQFFGFYDAARLGLVDPLPGQDSRWTLASAGLGLRLTGWHGLKATAAAGRTLRPGARTGDGRTRWHLAVTHEF
ncbi:MAG: ShlB/FhaC/HecB family hemolysin secretion/activation protein, partial [Sulfuritalea sp.]|nr:ShlB/FhaC/HecB family hemolysin secretion/activation protein [Sulfuritalea sp.]